MQSQANFGATTWSATHLLKLNDNNDSIKCLVFYYWLNGKYNGFKQTMKNNATRKKSKSQELKKGAKNIISKRAATEDRRNLSLKMHQILLSKIEKYLAF